jgi:tetraacyldisaccharide 4'-kinase
LGDVDFRICNGETAATGEIPMQLAGGVARALLDNREQDLAVFAGKRVHAVAAIGNPQRFFDSLCVHGIELIEHPFPDHHAFTAADLRFDDDLPVLMTSKDAVKCRGFVQPHWWSVPVRAVLPDSFFDAVYERIGGDAG